MVSAPPFSIAEPLLHLLISLHDLITFVNQRDDYEKKVMRTEARAGGRRCARQAPASGPFPPAHVCNRSPRGVRHSHVHAAFSRLRSA